MISKSTRGCDLGGLVRYLFGPGRANEHTNPRVVACSDPTWTGTVAADKAAVRDMTTELDDPKVRHSDGTKAGYVYHVAISIPKQDGCLDDSQWQRVARRFADKLRLDEQVRWVAVNHGASANGNDHIHLVVNLIRDDTGRAHSLSYDRPLRREACLELETELVLTATAPAGHGREISLSRREVELVSSGQVADVMDLNQYHIATLVRAVAAGSRSESEYVERLRGEGLVVRARHPREDRASVTGYSVAAKTGGREPLIWYGGGRLGKDLRLPALRMKWGQTDEQRRSAAPVWFSDAERRRKAEPGNLAGAADAMRQVAARLQKVPPEDRVSWQVAATGSAGILAAVAGTTTDDRIRRELIKAWQAVNLSTPESLSVGVDVAPGGAAHLCTPVPAAPETADPSTVRQRPVSMFSEPAPAAESNGDAASELATLLGGTSRVLMAARLSDAPQHAALQALLVQATELPAQITRTLAAQRDATTAQQRAADAAERALGVLVGAVRPRGWEFTQTGARVIAQARQAAAENVETVADRAGAVSPGHSVEPSNPGTVFRFDG